MMFFGSLFTALTQALFLRPLISSSRSRRWLSWMGINRSMLSPTQSKFGWRRSVPLWRTINFHRHLPPPVVIKVIDGGGNGAPSHLPLLRRLVRLAGPNALRSTCDWAPRPLHALRRPEVASRFLRPYLTIEPRVGSLVRALWPMRQPPY